MRRHLTLLTRPCPSLPSLPILSSFLILYIFLILYARHSFSHDPTSLFFDPSIAYKPHYSAIRQAEAKSFIEGARTSPFLRGNTTEEKPKICVGVATVNRNAHVQYFDLAIGGLLHGLAPSERKEIQLITLIAHTTPSIHPVYNSSWLRNVADEVLVYDLKGDALERMKGLEEEQGLFREKALWDYRYLLERCYESGAEQVLMLEDDVLAVEGWYGRTAKAVKEAERKTREMGRKEYLYLRLFYTEELLGWNSEEWPTYLFYSILITFIPLSILLLLRSRSTTLSRHLTPVHLLLSTFLLSPLLILLFFASGRISMLPLPAGVNPMQNFGCCSQALLFPRSRIPHLLSWYKDKGVGFVDMLTEELADRDGELRWAITPSVMQHIGRKSSKGDDFGNGAKWGLSVAEKLWSFEFERYGDGGVGRGG